MSVAFNENNQIVIGRQRGVEIELHDAKNKLSRRHAYLEFERKSQNVYLCDMFNEEEQRYSDSGVWVKLP